ncbi:hypothetical protein [Mesorhizobium sp.]|uniref:hypothetical protein n=1 Tax=Mesorhizobium sp. TaxID=1871066 RepID=UPI000FE97E1D|nr:hypothetical protein [Mesorhizobium sp.]RWD74800.1 MAG: hypothetical protein EOS37_01635 [Mesorhizobium sp.]
MNLREAQQRFHRLCLRLFDALGYEVAAETLQGEVRIDASVRKDEEHLLVEFVVVPARRPGLGILRDKVAGARAQMVETGSSARQRVLLSCMLDPAHLEWLQSEFDMEIWGRERILDELAALPADYQSLKKDFQEFVAKLRRLELVTLRASKNDVAGTTAPAPPPLPGFAESPVSPLDFGEAEEFSKYGDLRKRLVDTKRGPSHAKAYEVLIQDIVRYLFGDFLVDPRPQRRTERGLDFMDITYRVRSGHPFWDTLTRDFRTRAIIFECKNYTKGITPSQIYSTERYVNVGALRSVCFLVSREKPHEHAELAAFGAMREGGKLFVLLDDSHLHQMLNIRETQLRREAEKKTLKRDFEDDPSEVLDQAIYDFLTRMGR